MTITAKQDAFGITLFLEGRVDISTSPRLQDEILKAFQHEKSLTLDFSQVSYISSAGLRTLLIGQKTAAAKGAAMVLVNVGEQVMSVLDITGFSTVLTIRKDAEE